MSTRRHGFSRLDGAEHTPNLTCSDETLINTNAPRETSLCFVNQVGSTFATCLLDSSLFYWITIAWSGSSRFLAVGRLVTGLRCAKA